MSDTMSVKVGPKGRVVIPAAARRSLGIEEGDELAVVVDGESVRFIDRARLIEQIQQGFRDVGHSLSEELIAEHLVEADRDLA